MTQETVYQPAPQKKTGMAVTSMVLGILSLTLILYLPSLPGIILGIIGLKNVKKDPQEFGGKGMAMAGVITSSIAFVVGTALLGLLITGGAIGINAANAMEAKNTNNAKSTVSACLSYATENGGSFPESLDDLVPKYITDPEAFLYTSSDGDEKRFNYAKGLSGSADVDTPLIYSDEDWVGNRTVGFVGGHVKKVMDLELP